VKHLLHGLDTCCGFGTVSIVSYRNHWRSISLSILALGSVVGLFAFVVSEVGANDATEDVDADTLAQAQGFAGEYTFVGGQKERDGVAAAIETTVAAVSPMVRNLGRKRLQETNPIPGKISIAIDGDDVEILLDGDGHEASLGGAAIKAESAQGDKIKVSHRMRNGALVELIDGVGGDRSNTFKLNGDGTKLTMSVVISSSQLPVPVEYKLTFKRK
jgi:hypothetical protein